MSKSFLAAKKVRLGFRRFVHIFGKLTTPYLCDVWKQKTQILIAHQKEDIDRTKNYSSQPKSFLKRFRGFCTSLFFCYWPPPCLKAKNSNSYFHQKEDIDRTKKIQLATKVVKKGLEDFACFFLLLTTHYVMFESKKIKFLLLIRRKI